MQQKEKNFILIIVLIVLLDQLTKLLIISFFEKPVAVIKNVFYINYVSNTGAGFSLFHGLKNSNEFLIFTTFIIIGIILINYDKIENKLYPFFAMILGGAIGNLIDRMIFGAVIDFLDFKVFPIFNLADTAISIAGFFIVLHLLKEKDDNKKGGKK